MDTKFTVSFPGLGINEFVIDRVAFAPFGVEVYWYGLLIAFAVILSLLLAYRSAPRFGVKPDYVLDTIIAIVPAMIIFARIYYVIFQLDEFKGRPWSIFNLRTGGLGFYGGVIGGLLAIIIIARIRKTPLHRMVDLLVVYVPLGQGIGRWGNFFNQEAFGYNTTLPWGMYSDGTHAYLAHTGIGDPNLPVHPTFLYEFLANMLIFVVLIFIRKKSKRPYTTTAAYFALYGLVRFFVESLRTDSLYIPGTGLRVSMVLSAVMVITGVLFIVITSRKPIIEGQSGTVSFEQEQALRKPDTSSKEIKKEDK